MATTTRCARCGREIDAGTYLCERCREEEGPSLGTRIKPPSDLEERASRWPAWMPKPSPVQYHATVMMTVILILVGLGVFALISHHGVGPFTGRTVRSTYRSDGTLRVVAVVRNQGSKSAHANCKITPFVGKTYAETSDTVLTPLIAPHGNVTIHDVLHGVPAKPTDVVLNCS
jgi:hypothetical protein